MKKFTLKSLLLAAATLTAGSAMAQQPASVVFAMNDTDNPTAYVATEGAFSAATLELAEGLAFNGAKNITKPGGEDSGILALKVSNNSAEKADLLTWTVQPAEGLTFTPTHVKGYINRDGTDQEKSFTISVKKIGGEAIELGTYTAWRQGKDANQKDYDSEAVYFYDIELTAEQQAELAGEEGFVLMSTVGVPSGKSAFFGEVTIEGIVEGDEPEVPGVQPASVVFAMNDTDNPTAYVATEGAFSGATLELAEGLAFNGAKNITKPGGEDSGILALKVSNNSAEKADLLTWTVQPAEGLTFTPTHVKGYINRDGTDQEKSFTISVKKIDGEAIELGTYTAWRQGKDVNQKDYDSEAVYMYDIELTAEQQAELASSEGFVLMSTVGVPSGKSAFFGEVTIEGFVESNGGTTGIETVEAQIATGISYDLMGRRASDKGLMVRDGKVILVK